MRLIHLLAGGAALALAVGAGAARAQAPASPALGPRTSVPMTGVLIGNGPGKAIRPGVPGKDYLDPATGCPITGCTMKGAVGITVPGAPSLQSLQQAIADVSVLRGWGFIGDGASHPLSGIASFNGAPTSGWTLAQWQQVLPAATALTNEMDWASLQSMIAAATGPIAIRFPSDAPRARFDQPILVCAKSVGFFGAGGGTDTGQPAGTELEFTAGTDGLQHCGNATSKIEAHDLILTSDVTNGTNAGLRDTRANYTSLSNVTITGFNGYCGYLLNPSGTRFRSVRCINPQPAGTAGIGEGLHFEGKNGFINHIADTLVQGYSTAYHWISTNDITKGELGLEDTQVVNSACGGVQTCIVIEATNGQSYGPFNYSFLNMSVDVTTQFIAAPEVNNLLVYGGNWLLDVPAPGWGAPGNLFDFGTSLTSAHMVRLRDLWFVDNAKNSTFNSLVTVEAASNDVQIEGLHVDQVNATVTAAWFQVAGGAQNVVERDTSWHNFFAPTAPPANAVSFAGADPSNRMYSAGLGVPMLSSCGSGAALAPGSNSTEGTIVEGSGNPTGCTLSFSPPNRAVAPDVELFNTQGAYPLTMTTNGTGGFSYTHAAGSMTVHYRARPY